MHFSDFRWIQRAVSFYTADNDSFPEYPAIVKQLLIQRGIVDEKNAEAFLYPKLRDLADPFLMPDMQLAVDRLLQAIDKKEEVCIYGDYDVDGISSITILSRILRVYGLQARAFIPIRGSEGYGLSFCALERCFREGPKPDLLITVDCGTVSLEEIAYLKKSGIDVIVADHHEPHPDERPDCIAIVNPKCGKDWTYLCAAGVVFKIGHALMKTRSVSYDLKSLLDLVAMATISDIVPLIGENRIFVRHGLNLFSKSENYGLSALKKISGIQDRPSASDMGYRIGPRINAAGRMDVPEDAYRILNTESLQEAEDLACRLDNYNRQRQAYENKIRAEAADELLINFDPNNDAVIVLGSRNWHHGVVGIVASRLMRQYHKPTFIISFDKDGIGKGSGRSIPGISLVEALRSCSDHLIKGGGHAMAAGLSIEEQKLPEFRKAFSEYVRNHSSEEDRIPQMTYDTEVHFSQLNLALLDHYDLLQPFGNANPEPVFLSKNIFSEDLPFYMKNQHLRLVLNQEDSIQQAIYFGGGEHPLPEEPWDILYTIDRNTFRGKTSLQLTIQDLRSAK